MLIGTVEAKQKKTQKNPEAEVIEVTVFDDIGTETPSDFVIEELFKIINTRYLNDKKIIGTTNLNKAGLIEHYHGITGDRIVSRLSEMCDFVEINGNDYRESKT